MATAFELTRPTQGGRFDVTIYQMGWRLGGKGASGRGADDRIEEHGLHLWMGFYENAFRLMRECYAELGRDPRACHIASWEDAFSPAPHAAVVDRSPSGAWEPWVAHFPPGRGMPGDPLDDRNPFSVQGYMLQATALVIELIRSTQGGGDVRRPRHRAADGAGALAAAVDELLRYGRFATTAVLHEATDLLDALMATLLPTEHRAADGPLLQLIDGLAAEARRALAQAVGGDPALGRLWQVADLILAILRGALRFGLPWHPRGFDAIDDYEWRDWLRLNGATEASLDSGFVRGIYDLAFAYEGGDPARPRLAASVALRGAMRMFFTYRGSLFWRMNAGMGDIVFAPFYEVLRRRGVRFEFFHRLSDLALSAAVDGEPPHVTALAFDVQARVRGGRDYEPLVMVRDLPCWPAEPDYAQLDDGDALRDGGVRFESPWEPRAVGSRTLRVGDDFDFVVLAVGLGAVPVACPALVARDLRWRSMTERVGTVATQAFQLWMRDDMRALGWRRPAVNLSGFVEPFDTWADMGHLIPEESWSGRTRAIAYFCSALPDRGEPGEAHHDAQRARVRDNVVGFLERDVGALWPGALHRDGSFRWEALVASGAAGAAAAGPARVDTQFFTANVRPSDRYVLSLPGTQRYRVSPLDTGVDNLTCAGDWTESGLNTGCVESAVMSGLLAAHALSRSPPLEAIIGYDHP
jgi:uncharacterized protein with NAD-binding domain and iron-sulfur cluster